jgi:hypothetical protein
MKFGLRRWDAIASEIPGIQHTEDPYKQTTQTKNIALKEKRPKKLSKETAQWIPYRGGGSGWVVARRAFSPSQWNGTGLTYLARLRSLFSFDSGLTGTGDPAMPHSLPLVAAAAHPAIPLYASALLGPQQKRVCRACAVVEGRGARDDAPAARWYRRALGVAFRQRGSEQPRR